MQLICVANVLSREKKKRVSIGYKHTRSIFFKYLPYVWSLPLNVNTTCPVSMSYKRIFAFAKDTATLLGLVRQKSIEVGATTK